MVVIEQVIQGLRMKQIPAEMIIGTDARFVLMMVRMLPTWLIDQVIQLSFPPIPKVMKQQKLVNNFNL